MELEDTVVKDKEAIKEFLLSRGHKPPFWTTDEATKEFEFIWFGGPGVAGVQRKSDGKEGTIVWADGEAVLGHGHYGRIYFNFRES